MHGTRVVVNKVISCMDNLLVNRKIFRSHFFVFFTEKLAVMSNCVVN